MCVQGALPKRSANSVRCQASTNEHKEKKKKREKRDEETIVATKDGQKRFTQNNKKGQRKESTHGRRKKKKLVSHKICELRTHQCPGCNAASISSTSRREKLLARCTYNLCKQCNVIRLQFSRRHRFLHLRERTYAGKHVAGDVLTQRRYTKRRLDV